MKKRLLCVLVTILIGNLATVGVAESDSEVIQFDTPLTDGLEWSASESLESKESRALTTISLAMDLIIADKGVTPDLSKNTYIGKEGINIVVHYHGEGDDIIVIYQPITKTAAFQEIEASTDIVTKLAMEQACTDGTYENDLETVYSYVMEISNSLE